jgi:hypothetical protein
MKKGFLFVPLFFVCASLYAKPDAFISIGDVGEGWDGFNYFSYFEFPKLNLFFTPYVGMGFSTVNISLPTNNVNEVKFDLFPTELFVTPFHNTFLFLFVYLKTRWYVPDHEFNGVAGLRLSLVPDSMPEYYWGHISVFAEYITPNKFRMGLITEFMTMLLLGVGATHS